MQVLTPQSTYTRVIGVDVASNKLDVHDTKGSLSGVIPNTFSSINAKLVAKLRDLGDVLVICEASGGYERVLVDAMQIAGIDVAIANARQVRDFAKGHGLLEKTDVIDAAVIAKFGCDVNVHLAPVKTDAERAFAALVRRRSQVIQTLQAEKNRLTNDPDKVTTEMIGETISHLKSQLKTLDDKIAEGLDAQAKSDPKIDVIRSVPGVGVVTTATLAAELPELGELSRAKIAKLVGVAPIVRQSGQSDKKRKTRGGRVQVRNVLYMAALVAIRHNPLIKRFYNRLITKGKLPKVALTACMRKLLTVLNDMVRNGERWRDADTCLSK